MARSRWKKVLVVAGGALIAVLAVAQAVPYGRDHSNPPVTAEPRWSGPEIRALAERACFDCHSNETRWPWYANVAPMSWVVQRDVQAARDTVNFSEWNRPYDLAPYSGQSVILGGMPPAKYRMAHPEADLTKAELLELAHGLDETLHAATRR